jgi:arsenate reductase-like glutaredoxin family protein
MRFSPHIEAIMANSATLAEIEGRIQLVENNLRQLMEQAAAYSGAADEERNADRIADQEAKLEALLKERAALIEKGG